jgi:hypothetical protein
VHWLVCFQLFTRIRDVCFRSLQMAGESFVCTYPSTLVGLVDHKLGQEQIAAIPLEERRDLHLLGPMFVARRPRAHLP